MIPAQYVPALISQYLALVGLPHSLVALHLLLELRLQLPLGRLPTHHEVRPQRGEAVSTARLGEGGVRGERGGRERENERELISAHSPYHTHHSPGHLLG